MKNSLMIGMVAVLAACSPAYAGEFNDKPVMCGNDEEMFGVVHAMRSRIMTSPSFDGDRILTHPVGIALFPLHAKAANCPGTECRSSR